MKATGIVRRVDDWRRILIPKEIRHTRNIRNDDPSHAALTSFDLFRCGILKLQKKYSGAEKLLRFRL